MFGFGSTGLSISVLFVLVEVTGLFQCCLFLVEMTDLLQYCLFFVEVTGLFVLFVFG